MQAGKVKIKVVFGIWDETDPAPPGARKPGKVHETFRWSDVTRLGPHAPLGLPAELEFKVHETPYLECDTRAIIRLPLAASPDQPIEVTATGPGRLVLHDPAYTARPMRVNGGNAATPTGDPPAFAWL